VDYKRWGWGWGGVGGGRVMVKFETQKALLFHSQVLIGTFQFEWGLPILPADEWGRFQWSQRLIVLMFFKSPHLSEACSWMSEPNYVLFKKWDEGERIWKVTRTAELETLRLN
jgi:hypothetical protein